MGGAFTFCYRVCLLGLQNFLRNAWLSLAAIMVMTVTLACVLAGVILNITARNVISDIAQDLKASVYLLPQASETDINRLQSALRAQPVVSDVTYVSSQTAEDNFNARYADDIELKEALLLLADEDVLPASIEVGVSDLEQMEAIRDMISGERFASVVDSVSLSKTDAQATIEQGVAMQNALTKLSIFLVLLFSGIAILVIFNTIRMAVFARREEVQIMHLLGANRSFIRYPFLVEASLYGVIAGVISTAFIVGGLHSLKDTILQSPDLSESYMYFRQIKIVLAMFVFSSVLGIAVSLLSSAWALGRHLRL